MDAQNGGKEAGTILRNGHHGTHAAYDDACRGARQNLTLVTHNTADFTSLLRTGLRLVALAGPLTEKQS